MAKPPGPVDDPDSIETLPAAETVAESVTPPSSDTWDSEATTSVHTLRPLFAPPPRLPTT